MGSKEAATAHPLKYVGQQCMAVTNHVGMAASYRGCDSESTIHCRRGERMHDEVQPVACFSSSPLSSLLFSSFAARDDVLPSRTVRENLSRPLAMPHSAGGFCISLQEMCDLFTSSGAVKPLRARPCHPQHTQHKLQYILTMAVNSVGSCEYVLEN